MTIVGYDDTISKNKFSIKPQHDGAWIVKNSWGTHANDAGYFYLSYDQPVNAVVAVSYTHLSMVPSLILPYTMANARELC